MSEPMVTNKEGTKKTNLFGTRTACEGYCPPFDRPRFSKPCVSILSYERLAQEATRGFSVLLP